MTKNDYFSLREDIMIQNNVSRYSKYLFDMFEIYPIFRSMTGQEIEDYLKDRYTEFENRIQNKLVTGC